MDQNRLTEFVFAHHAEKVVAEDNITDEAENYPMITRRGEAQTREKAQMLVSVINKMPAGSVLVLGGISKAARTQSTLKVYADELRKLLSGRKDIIFFEPPSKNGNMLTTLAEFCKVDRGKEIKTVIEFPYLVSEFIGLPGQREEEIAGILAGLDREESFFRGYFPDKQITFLNIGHSQEMDTLITFLNRKNNNGFKGKASFFFM